jgi:hypothetical protein
MFLFKKKKQSPEIKTEVQKTEVRKTAPPVKVVDKTANKAAEVKPVKETPVRMKTPEIPMFDTSGKNPDEIADSLLVKVAPNPDIENAVSEDQIQAVLKPVIAIPEVEVSNTPAETRKTAETPSGTGTGPKNDGIAPAAPAVAAVPDVPQKRAASSNTVVETKADGQAVNKPAAAESKPAGAEGKATEEAKKPEGEKKPDEAKKGAEGEDKGNIFSNLFGKADVEEETPLDRLIKSLPDISIDEVVNEAEEVKSLISEWYQNQPSK